MPSVGNHFALRAQTEVLIVYALNGGASARFLPGVVKSTRRFGTSARVHEPAHLLEGITLADSLSKVEGMQSLATDAFEQALFAVAADAMGEKAASRLTIFVEHHHLIAVDSKQVLEV